MSEMMRSTLGDYALLQELWGQWSGISIQHDQSATKPKLSRREFLHLTSNVVIATTGLIAARSVENFSIPWELTTEERERLVSLAALFPDQEFGIHPDFEAPSLEDPSVEGPDPEAWSKSTDFLRDLEGDHFATVFVTLQDCEIPAAMEKTRVRIHSMLKRNVRPLISLGLRQRGMMGHPFDAINERQLTAWMKQWGSFLHGFKDVPMDIRFLFEMQVPPLSWVSYCRSFAMDDELHAERFRYLHTQMYRITQHVGLSNLRFIICGSSAGGSLLSYLPSEGVGGVGTDLFDFSGGHQQPLALFNLIFGLSYIQSEVDRTLTDLQEASSLAGNVPMYLCEIGSLTHDKDWIESVLLKAFAQGVRGAGWLNYNKAYTNRPTETNWQVTPEMLAMLVRLQRSIQAKRSRN